MPVVPRRTVLKAALLGVCGRVHGAAGIDQVLSPENQQRPLWTAIDRALEKVHGGAGHRVDMRRHQAVGAADRHCRGGCASCTVATHLAMRPDAPRRVTVSMSAVHRVGDREELGALLWNALEGSLKPVVTGLPLQEVVEAMLFAYPLCRRRLLAGTCNAGHWVTLTDRASRLARSCLKVHPAGQTEAYAVVRMHVSGLEASEYRRVHAEGDR